MARALRHHHARNGALASRALAQVPRVDGLRAWLHAFLSTLRTKAGNRRLGLPAVLRKPSTLRALAPRPAFGTHRRLNQPRRLLATGAGWFAFGPR